MLCLFQLPCHISNSVPKPTVTWSHIDKTEDIKKDRLDKPFIDTDRIQVTEDGKLNTLQRKRSKF